MEILGERPAWSMSDSEKVSRLDAAVAEINRLKTYCLHITADLDASGYAKDIGAGDTARFLSMRYRIDTAEARRDVRLAIALSKYDAVAAALPDHAVPFPEDTDAPTGRGRPMHPAQAAAIVSTLEKVPTSVPAENLQTAERQLVNLARTFTPGQLRDAGQRMRNILDTDGPEPNEKAADKRESLTLQAADNGVKFRGFLANDNAELFRTLIHAGAKPHKTLDGEPDPRARDKRQADALSALLTTAAGVMHSVGASTTNAAGNRPTASGPTDDGAHIPGHGPKAHLTITIDFDALKAATADAMGDTVFGDGLSAAAVRRLACDAQVIPVVLGSKSQPLDVGTTKRLVTDPIRLALNARDRGCVVCGAPPIQCEAHHLVHWIDGGETCVSNMILLCKRHHIDLHAGHWHIEIIDDVVHVTRPTWATPDPIPPDKYRASTHNEAERDSSRSADRAWPTAGAASRDVIRQAIWGDDAQPAQRGSGSPESDPPPTTIRTESQVPSDKARDLIANRSHDNRPALAPEARIH